MALTLSIVVCSYNQGSFIRETLESVVNQQDLRPGELETIVIDGASTDGSAEIIAEYKNRLTYFVSESDRGQTHALNKGFAKASGGILGWLCSDDLLEPRAVRFVLDYFSERPQTSFVYGDAKLIGANGELLKIRKEIPFKWFLWKYLDHNYIPQSSAFWRRNLHREVNGLDETFDLGMDADLFARFAERTELCHVKKVLSSVRSYPQAKSQRMLTDSIDDMRRICLRYGVDHSRSGTRMLKLAARLYRMSWKTARGCYW